MSAKMIAHETLNPRQLLKALRSYRKGDFSVRLPTDLDGIDGEIAEAFNDVVEMNESITKEFERISNVVGKEGKITQRVKLAGATGGWGAKIDSVNTLIGDMVQPTTEVARVIGAVAQGDLSQVMQLEIDGRVLRGEFMRIAKVVNAMVDQLNSFASEVSRVAREVGTEGKLGGQARVKGVGGTWKDLTDNLNFMAANLTGQVRNIAEVTTAVARGDLSKKITVDVKGEILELKNTINTMVDQLNSFAAEVSRVAREVGTEGKLGGQADVKGVGGTWKDLTDNVNYMAANLTGQVRNIANVVTAVANGDLKRKLAVDAKGEIATLADTINGMIETLATFADQVTNVAREVGIEGKLGGQAKVPGAAGLWRDLTDNVNQLAANLTTQVRAIAEVATAVTKGDLTRSITVEALGEVAALKDNINEMIRNLKDTTLKNTEQDWLKTNLARFTRMLQGERDLGMVSKLILSELAPLVNAQHGVFYINRKQEDQPEPVLELLASYAYKKRKNLSNRFKLSEGLVGQCAYEKERILITNVPDNYVHVASGLGEAPPRNIIVLPVLFEGEVKAVIELASFNQFSETHQSFLDQLTESIGIVLNTIAANMRTEDLLKQSQSLTAELQSQQEELKQTNDRLEQQAENLQKSEELLKNQQEELQQTNEELEEKARLLSQQMSEVESKNAEVEFAKAALEEKAEQLTLTSKYKSEFLANMSHELRTPLNSLLILSKLLADNPDNTLTPKQIEYAQTIYASGADLLSLINDILDLSKIESGTVTLDITQERFTGIRDYVEQTFGVLAQNKNLEFTIKLDENLPEAIQTDEKRLQQILKNLLSNAFKFTEQGRVEMRIEPVHRGWSAGLDTLNRAEKVIAFSVADTGIGISPEKQGIIFEAFQQADGTTSRKFGGTGLGLSISREIATLLGGEIRVSSTPGKGSIFTLYLPLNYKPFANKGTVLPGIAKSMGSSLDSQGPDSVSEDDLSLLEQSGIRDDRDDLQPNDRVLLIVENDISFAPILIDLAHEKNFKAVVALRGHAALAIAKKYRPDAITLDIRLPDIDGWAVLDHLKHDPQTRHIPVHVISVEGQRQRGLQMGAIGFLEKPADKESLLAALSGINDFIDRRVKKLLVVEDDEVQRNNIVQLIGNGDVETTTVGTGQAALDLLQQPGRFDCIVVDLKLPDMRGIDLIERIRESDVVANLPIIVYTAKDLTRKEETALKKLAETIIIKDVKSPERLLDETALFLHRAMENMPEAKRQILKLLHQRDPVLAGKKVLIVDDDIRNIFSLTSVLEHQLMDVVYAENGKDGVQMLKDTPGVDIVLMDVMMPEMDGYDTIRLIRSMEQFIKLPIIALTAKAMKGDRDKCIEAGASDYIAKPVDIEQLLSLLRVWLYR